jgi:glycosyltransferase involved in cell wall biosynthesis
MYKPQKSEIEQQIFFRKSYDKFLQAKDAAGEINFYYRIANTTICLKFAGNELVPFLTPALEHLRLTGEPLPDLTICIWDSDSTHVEMIPPPCTKDCFTDRGDIWGFNSRRIKAAFHWIECSVNLMDLEKNTGFFWVQSARTLPYWVLASPLRTLFHWWMEKNGCQLLHAAAVGTSDGAVLITGKGGVGKSTAALSCLQSDLFYLADDYVIARLEPAPAVVSLYSTAKLNADHVANFPDLSGLINNTEKLDQEKAVIFLHPELSRKIVLEMPLRAIVTPQIVDRSNSLTKSVSRWDIQRAMSFTTMSQLPYVGRHTHDYISRLASSLPHYILEVGKDFSGIPAAISGLLSGMDTAPPVKDIEPWSSRGIEERPLVSVIIPVFNGENFIREAVENVLSQKYPALEVIIINDGSTDRTEEIIRQLPADVRYFTQQNCGPSAARNKGIQDASGEFITFLDADDLWPENNLNIMVDEMLKNPGMDVIRGYAQLMEFNKTSGCYEYIGNPKESFPHYIGAAIYRKSAFEKVGLFDSMLRFGEDSDWYLRAGELNLNIKRLEETSLFVRRHGGNMTEGRNMLELNVMKVFKKSLERRRKQEQVNTLKPLVSVIIPVFNTEKYLGEAIQSVLSQSYKPLEIIIVDDGSTDNTAKIVESFGSLVRYHYQKNSGPGAARNQGIKMANGDFFAFLDADDLWMADKMKLQWMAFEEDPRLDMAFGHIQQFHTPELPQAQKDRTRIPVEIMPGHHAGSMLIKKEAFLRTGLFKEELRVGEFIDWYARATELNLKSIMLPDVLMKRRIHGTNLGIYQHDQRTGYVHVLKAALDRRRAGG